MNKYKTIKSKWAIAFQICFASILVQSLASCNDKDLDLSDDISGSLNSVSTQWNATQDEISDHMRGFTLQYSDNNTLIYANPQNDQHISYRFTNGTLSASSIVFPSMEDFDIKSILKGTYEFIGDVNNATIYANTQDNILASIWPKPDNYSDFSAIGFSPIKSEAYNHVEGYSVKTLDNIEILPYKAHVSGNLSGVKTTCEAGMIYSMNPDFPTDETQTKTVKVSSGKFDITLTGLIGEQTYYYRAYAIIDKVKYYGELKSLKAAPMTYSFGDKTFKMVKVEGGPYGDFFIMESEFLPFEKISFGDTQIPYTMDDGDKTDGRITRYEFKKIVREIMRITGLPFRLPTTEEWQYVYSGGAKSKGYRYSGSDDINDVAWYSGNSGGKLHEFDLKNPNELGVYNMSGNYAELTCDAGIEDIKAHMYLNGPIYDTSGDAYGGSYKQDADDCQKTSRIINPFANSVLVSGNYVSFRFIVDCHPKAFVPVDAIK